MSETKRSDKASRQSRVGRWFAIFRQFRWKMVAAGILIGIVSGVLVVLYRFGIEYGTQFAYQAFRMMRVYPLAILIAVILMVGIGWFIGWSAQRESMASGSGIPQVVGYITRGLCMRWYTILPVRFSAGLLGSLCGLSLGREGPSIQIGACGGQIVSRFLRALRHTPVKNDIKEHYAVTAGAAAGLSAAFCAPLSAVMFALEEVQHSLAPTVLMGAASASLAADFIAQYCFGLRPVLDFGNIVELPIALHWWLLPLGVIAGIVGVLINRSLLGFQQAYRLLPAWSRAPLACLVALPVGLFIPQVLGGGSKLVDLAEYGKISVVALLIMFIMKILFTSSSFGCGAPGGIFMPILAVGALAGGICARLMTQYFGIENRYIAIIAVCVMAGTLAASVKAPLTSILLTVEMSGTLIHMLPVAVCAFLAMLVSDVLRTKPIYSALLERYMRSHRKLSVVSLHAGDNAQDVELLVATGSACEGTSTACLRLPRGARLISVCRIGQRLTPGEALAVRAGDTLIVRVQAGNSGDTLQALRRLMEAQL